MLFQKNYGSSLRIRPFLPEPGHSYQHWGALTRTWPLLSEPRRAYPNLATLIRTEARLPEPDHSYPNRGALTRTRATFALGTPHYDQAKRLTLVILPRSSMSLTTFSSFYRIFTLCFLPFTARPRFPGLPAVVFPLFSLSVIFLLPQDCVFPVFLR